MKFFNPRRISTAALAFALLNLNSNYALAQAIPLASVPAYTSDQLEKLVGPIALYPDDLISITLPATTYPLDIVKAQRFLEKLKVDNKAKPDASMPDPVLKLLNYPDIIKKMNDDLDWMQQLGEAVDTDEAAVLAAIQSFRRKAQSVGNLKSDDKQVIVVEKEVIVIKPANPEIIYVPTYQPSTVVTYSSTPYPYSYYPTPYPSYYYPYAPGAAFATGLIWGAAIGGAWNTNWSGGSINHNTNININNNNKNINTGANRSTSGGSNWRNSSAPTQTKAGAQTRQASAGTRPGDAQSGGSRQASAASANSAARSNASVNTAQSNRSTQQASARNTGGSTTSAGNMSSRSPQSGTRDNAFNGVQSSGASANRASTRGANSMSSPSARSASSGARSGGARSGGGRR